MNLAAHFDYVRNMLDNMLGHELAVTIAICVLLAICIINTLLIASEIKDFKNARKNLGKGKKS